MKKFTIIFSNEEYEKYVLPTISKEGVFNEFIKEKVIGLILEQIKFNLQHKNSQPNKKSEKEFIL